MQERGVGHIENILGGPMQRGFEIRHVANVGISPILQAGELKRLVVRARRGVCINPHKPLLLPDGKRGNTPRLPRGFPHQCRNLFAGPLPIKLPAVVGTLNTPLSTAPLRERSVAMGTSVHQGVGCPSLVPKNNQGGIPETHRERLVSKLRGLTGDIPVGVRVMHREVGAGGHPQFRRYVHQRPFSCDLLNLPLPSGLNKPPLRRAPSAASPPP